MGMKRQENIPYLRGGRNRPPRRLAILVLGNGRKRGSLRRDTQRHVKEAPRSHLKLRGLTQTAHDTCDVSAVCLCACLSAVVSPMARLVDGNA